MTIMSEASMISAPGASSVGPTATISPLRTCTSAFSRTPSLGSTVITAPPRIRRSGRPGSVTEDGMGCASDGARGSEAAIAAAPAVRSSARREKLVFSVMRERPSLLSHQDEEKDEISSSPVLNLPLFGDAQRQNAAIGARILLVEQNLW